MAIAPERLARLEAMLDRQDIHDCLQRISRGIDRFDKAMFLSGYHADAQIDAGALVGSPEQAYDSGMALHEEGQSATLHNLLNHRRGKPDFIQENLILRGCAVIRNLYPHLVHGLAQ